MDSKYIYMTGFAGAFGTYRMALENESLIRSDFSCCFSDHLIESAEKYLKETETESIFPDSGEFFAAGSGGLENLFYNLSVEYGEKIVVDLFSIPIRQETVELCELFGLNPYRMDSTGVYICISNDPKKVPAAFFKNPAVPVIIGRTADGRGAFFDMDGDRRCMEPLHYDDPYGYIKSVY